jgi:hypothetical protein
LCQIVCARFHKSCGKTPPKFKIYISEFHLLKSKLRVKIVHKNINYNRQKAKDMKCKPTHVKFPLVLPLEDPK